MLVASGTLINPQTRSLRALSSGLATESRLRTGGHVYLCSVLITPP